jgi:hypothetical protein
VAAVLLLPTITLNRAKRRVITSLQQELGRRVIADDIHLQLVPWPGVELTNVRLDESPAFGSEDMITAESATATLRLMSLWNGRLEFSSVTLSNANINVVRNSQGRWNFAELLSGAARSSLPLRPTADVPSLRQPPRFPYLEVADGRVNLKLGDEKQRIYLQNVQASLALERGRWRVRARFQPARTDVSLTDAGQVMLDGWWQSGRRPFGELPFDLSLRVSDAYLAGTSALVAGHDAGVHGVVNALMRVHGSGRQFTATGNFEADSLRRWDLLPSSMSLRGNVAAAYSPGEDTLTIGLTADDQCIRLSGRVERLFTAPRPLLTLELHNLQASSLVSLARAVKGRLPENLAARGTINGSATIQTAPDQRAFWKWPAGSGSFAASSVELSSGKDRLVIPSAMAQWNGTSFDISVPPASLITADGVPAQINLDARLNRNGFELAFGSAALPGRHVRALAHLCGFDAPWPENLRGVARVQLAAAAPWSAFRSLSWSGVAQLGPSLYMLGPSAVALDGATLLYQPSGVLSAQFAGTLGHSAFAGSAAIDLASGRNEFDLRLPRAFGSDLQRLFTVRRSAGLARLLGTTRSSADLPQMNAQGSVEIRQLEWRGYRFALKTHLSGRNGIWEFSGAGLRTSNGVVRVSSLRCDSRGCEGDGRVIGARISQWLAADAQGDDATAESSLASWQGRVSGTLFADFHLALPFTPQPLQANGHFLLYNGGLNAPTEAGQRLAAATGVPAVLSTEGVRIATPTDIARRETRASSLHFISFAGAYSLADNKLSIRDAQMVTFHRRLAIRAASMLADFPRELYARTLDSFNPSAPSAATTQAADPDKR